MFPHLSKSKIVNFLLFITNSMIYLLPSSLNLHMVSLDTATEASVTSCEQNLTLQKDIVIYEVHAC